MIRTFIMTLAVGSFAVISTGSIASAADKCTIVKATDDNPVAKACKKGGVDEAKKVMKAMVAKAKKAGMKELTCDSCHKAQADGNFELTKDAEKLFQDMMAKQ